MIIHDERPKLIAQYKVSWTFSPIYLTNSHVLRHPREARRTFVARTPMHTHNLRTFFFHEHHSIQPFENKLQSMTNCHFSYAMRSETNVYIQYSAFIRIRSRTLDILSESNKTLANVTTFVRCSSHLFRHRFIPREIP